MPQESYRPQNIEPHPKRLPHHEVPGGSYFLTFALQRPATIDLTDEAIAPLVVAALRFFDGQRYLLYDYTVMPDPVHLILTPLAREAECEPLSRITHSLKSWLAHEINKMLGRKGSIWQDETYDHVLRNEQDYAEKAAYIHETTPAGEGWCTTRPSGRGGEQAAGASRRSHPAAGETPAPREVVHEARPALHHPPHPLRRPRLPPS